jgi:DnaJ-domain-containing protein 1
MTKIVIECFFYDFLEFFVLEMNLNISVLSVSVLLALITLFAILVEARDLYEILGVSKLATIPEIKKAFRNLAMIHHPDKTKEKNAEAKFREIVEGIDWICLYQKLKLDFSKSIL